MICLVFSMSPFSYFTIKRIYIPLFWNVINILLVLNFHCSAEFGVDRTQINECNYWGVLLVLGKGCLWKSASPWKVLLLFIVSGMVAKLIHGFCRAWTCTTNSWGQPWGLPQSHMHPTHLLTVQIRHKPKRKNMTDSSTGRSRTATLNTPR